MRRRWGEEGDVRREDLGLSPLCQGTVDEELKHQTRKSMKYPQNVMQSSSGSNAKTYITIGEI